MNKDYLATKTTAEREGLDREKSAIDCAKKLAKTHNRNIEAWYSQRYDFFYHVYKDKDEREYHKFNDGKFIFST